METNPVLVKFGNRLRETREEKKMTQRELADKVDMTEQLLKELEGGLIDPSLECLLLLGRGLGIHLKDFFEVPY